MDTETSRKIVMEAWAAFASRDPARIGAVFAEDADWLAQPGNATAVALDMPSHIIGREALTAFLDEGFRRLYNDVDVTFRGFYADGARVIVEETMTATLPDGRPYKNDYCFVFELENGLIRHVREYMDTAAGHRMVFG